MFDSGHSLPSASALQVIGNETIPLVDYGYVNGSYIGPQFNPVTVAQKIIKEYQSLNTSNDQYNETLGQIIVQSDWILGNAWDMKNYSILAYSFRFEPYNMSPPWFSAMAQGLSIQALGYTYKLTNDEKYLSGAKKLLQTFFIDVKQGGVTHKTSDTGWWYEEYASPIDTKAPRVLNGMMYTVLGLYEFYNMTHNVDAKYLFEQGVKSLKNNLKWYDRGKYSMYDAVGKPASLFYHKVHLRLLLMLYSITKDQQFFDYYQLWKKAL